MTDYGSTHWQDEWAGKMQQAFISFIDVLMGTFFLFVLKERGQTHRLCFDKFIWSASIFHLLPFCIGLGIIANQLPLDARCIPTHTMQGLGNWRVYMSRMLSTQRTRHEGSQFMPKQSRYRSGCDEFRDANLWGRKLGLTAKTTYKRKGTMY